jgi:hypothetical protein
MCRAVAVSLRTSYVCVSLSLMRCCRRRISVQFHKRFKARDGVHVSHDDGGGIVAIRREHVRYDGSSDVLHCVVCECGVPVVRIHVQRPRRRLPLRSISGQLPQLQRRHSVRMCLHQSVALGCPPLFLLSMLAAFQSDRRHCRCSFASNDRTIVSQR